MNDDPELPTIKTMPVEIVIRERPDDLAEMIAADKQASWLAAWREGVKRMHDALEGTKCD